MPKKTASARGGASRNKPKPQKSIQLVRPASADNDMQNESSEVEEETPLAVSTSKATVASTATVSKKAEVATSKKPETESVSAQQGKDADETPGMNKSSAAARLAARRQTALRQQVQRSANLVTAEHYAYVRRDLIYILILAVIMFSAIIILHFVPAIGG